MRGLSLNSFDLKLLAVVFMVIDHIGFYFLDAPMWLRYLGRISYPLFLFCLVWSYHYTHSRWQFCLRLYLMGLFMAAFRWWVDWRWPTDGLGFSNHNIFVNLLLTCLLISVIELAGRDKLRCGLLLGALAALQLAFFYVPRYLLPQLRQFSGDYVTAVFPNLALNEYGFMFAALGAAMYFLKEKPGKLAAVYLLFCLYQFSDEMLYGMLFQCYMVLALPFMLIYNRRKGRGWKWFFYIFYPAHAFLLFYLANFVFK